MTGVRSCYDEGKRTAETLTMDYHRGADVEVCILLYLDICVYFSVYILVLSIMIVKQNNNNLREQLII